MATMSTTGDSTSVDLNPGTPLTEMMERGEPSYELTIRVFPPVVNVGRFTAGKRTVRILLRVAGWGKIGESKIWVDSPFGLLDASNPGWAYHGIGIEGQVPHTRLKTGERIPGTRLSDGGFTVHEAWVVSVPAGGPRPGGHDLPQVLGETIKNGRTAYFAEMNLRADATPGDHPIVAVMTYWSGTKWCTSRAAALLHVNDWHERWGAWADPLTLILALSGWIAVAVAVVAIH